MRTQSPNQRADKPSGLALGTTITTAIILIIGGVCHAMEGVVGLATNEFYVATQRWIFQFDVTTWGWIHILVGVIASYFDLKKSDRVQREPGVGRIAGSADC